MNAFKEAVMAPPPSDDRGQMLRALRTALPAGR
jgi:hypothetical protein